MLSNGSKYKLIVNYVISGILSGTYTERSWIPSIQDFMKKYKLSRDTVLKGLAELKSKGIVESKQGLGYYVISTRVSHQQKVFLLFNEFNAFKEELYNSFMNSLGHSATVNLYFHNYNREVFDTLINEANGKYTTYIIMSGKFEGVGPTLDKLNGRVFLLDHFHRELYGKYSAVFQNFEKNTYDALVFGHHDIKKYGKIIMVQKEEKEPYERYYGMKNFCKEFGYSFEYIHTLHNRSISKGELYMVVNDLDIVELIKQVEKKKYSIGKDIGIISFNETPLKEVLAGGITTLSTDFTLMGITMAEMIKGKTISMVENPWKLRVRRSL